MEDTDQGMDHRQLVTPPPPVEQVDHHGTGRSECQRDSEQRDRSHTRWSSRQRRRSRTRSRSRSHRHERDRHQDSEGRSRSRSRHVSHRARRCSQSHSRNQGAVNRNSRRMTDRHHRSRSGSYIKRTDLYERLKLLEDEICRERGRNNMFSNNRSRSPLSRPKRSAIKQNNPKLEPEAISEVSERKPLSETSELLELFTDFFKGKGGTRESFPVLNNVLPDFDPLSKEQTIDVWISKVDESAEIYNWNDKHTVHYALPKLTGLAKTWYQGLPSIKYSWSEWKQMLKDSFPSDENYAELLTEMLARRTLPGESLELYYFSKINLLNRCKIFGKNAVDCIVFGIEDKGIRLSTQAGKYNKPEEILQFFKTVKIQSKESNDCRNDYTFGDKRSPNNTSSNSNAYQPRPYDQQKNDRPRRGLIVGFNCKESGHPSFKCPKPVSKCLVCNYIGHSSGDCPRKDVNNKDNTHT